MVDAPEPVEHMRVSRLPSETDGRRQLELARPLAFAADRSEKRARGSEDLDAEVARIDDVDVPGRVDADVHDAEELCLLVPLFADAELFFEVELDLPVDRFGRIGHDPDAVFREDFSLPAGLLGRPGEGQEADGERGDTEG